MQEPGMAQQPGMQEPGMQEPELARNALCPADIEGLSVRVSTIPRGGALVLTATGDEAVEDLRDRLDRFAQMHRQQHQGAMGEQAQFADASALIHQASEVRVVDIPRGARLEVRLDDADKVQDLRAELREDASMLREGLCPLALQLETT